MEKRDVRFDILKLIAMFGIVFIHCVSNCGVLDTIDYLSWEYFVVSVLNTVFFSATNVFVIISSHLLIKRFKTNLNSIRFKKIFNLVIITSIYSTVIYVGLVVLGFAEFSLFAFLKSIFSVFVNQYWFVGAYLFLYFISPMLYRALDIFSEKELRTICIICLTVFSVFPSLFIFSSVLDFYDSQHGKSIIWMMILFTFTFYLNKFGTEVINKIKKIQIIVVASLATAILVISRIVLRFISFYLNMGGDGEGRLFFDESVFILAISFCIFIFTLKTDRIDLPQKANRFISSCAGTTLGIYLIHNNPHLREVLWEKAGTFIFSKNGMEMVYIIIVVIAIFVSCMFFELAVKSVTDVKQHKGK